MREDIFEIGNEGLSVTELSQKLALPTGEVVKTLFMQGIMVQVNQVCCLPLAASLCCCRSIFRGIFRDTDTSELVG